MPQKIEIWHKIPIWKMAKNNEMDNLYRALHCAKGYYFLKQRKDKRGEFIHCYRVVQVLLSYGIINEKILILGAFHDLYEEISFDLYYEIMAGYGEDIAFLVWILSRQPKVSNKVYFSRIGENLFAILVKIADRLHNLRNLNKNLGTGDFFTKDRLEDQIAETIEFIIPMTESALKLDSRFGGELDCMYRDLLNAIAEAKNNLGA